MTQSLAVPNADYAPLQRLDPYDGGLSDEAPRVDALAVISCGYRGKAEGNRPGLPRSSRADDAQQIHLHDPYGRAPGLAEALAAGDHKRLVIAFPLDDPRQFVIQRFTRYSASRLELYGDESSITEIVGGDNPRHVRHDAGTEAYERLVKTCKADTRIYFCLAEWGANGPEVVFPDGLGTYAIRTTSRHSVRSILGTLAYTARFTHSRIAGIPFLLTVDHREVAGPDGSKRNIPVWTITTKPPEGARLSSRTFRELATSALKEGAQLMLPAPDERTWEQMEADGPAADLVVEEPTADELRMMADGGACDLNHWIRTWHALARNTAWDSDAARESFIGSYTKGQVTSLSAFLRGATEKQAAELITALGAAITRALEPTRAADYDRMYGHQDDDLPPSPTEVVQAPCSHCGTEQRCQFDRAERGYFCVDTAACADRQAAAKHQAAEVSEPAAVDDRFRCEKCSEVILDQFEQPINESQAALVRDRFGDLVCKNCRPKRAKSVAAAEQEALPS